MKYHAVMLDETHCEFGVDIEARNRDEAWSILEEDYPESRCVQLETTDDTMKRERLMYEHIEKGGDWDEDGRPIFPAGYDWDEEGDDE